MSELAGDRMCFDCEEETLVEHTLRTWKCLKCGQIIGDDYLDGEESESSE